MKKAANIILLALAVISGADAVSDTVRDETKDIPAIVQAVSGQEAPPQNSISSEKNESDVGTALKYGAAGALAAGAGLMREKKTEGSLVRHDIERFIVHRIKRERLTPLQVAVALRESEQGFQELVRYLAEELEFPSVRIEKLRATSDRGKLIVYVTAAYDGHDSEKFAEFWELFVELISEKIDLAAELAEQRHIDFKEALRLAIDDELKLGKEALVKLLRSKQSSTWATGGLGKVFGGVSDVMHPK